MKKYARLWMMGLLAMCLLLFSGCSAQDIQLPRQLDLTPGQSYALSQAVRVDGAEPGTAETAQALAVLQKVPELGLSCATTNRWVASVSESGVVTAVAPGTATVTVNCAALNASYSVEVTVTSLPQGMTMDAALTLPVGGAQPLDVTVTPMEAAASVRYSSENPAVATVDPSGVVTGISTGETAVTAVLPGTSYISTCTVTVGEAVSGIAISRAEIALAPGEQQLLTAETAVSGGQRTSEIVWQSSDPATATVMTDGLIQAVAPGTAEISASADGKTAVCVVTVEGTATPESATPESATPESAAPESATPESATPESATPESATPESATPESATPESATPESATLESATLESATPESATPESATPESATPESATPESATPESATPESATLESATPESATPESATPEDASRKETISPAPAAAKTSTSTSPSPEKKDKPTATPNPSPAAAHKIVTLKPVSGGK
jgi:uncharacterized protein YjdB